ncbi:MAG: hypothetical protein ACPGVO_08430 [Spirulinaceae cyanobacterium]
MRDPDPCSSWKLSRLKPLGRILAGVSLLGLGQFLLLSPVAIAQISQATITEILDGDEVFVETADGGNIPATVDAIVDFQETVRTEDARAALVFDNGSAGRMGSQSEVTVGQCIEVQQGILLAAGPANGCTATFAIGVQGTIYAIASDPETGDQRLQVLEGVVEVQLTDSSSTSDTTAELEPAQQIGTGEELTITADGRLGPRRRLTRREVERLLRSEVFRDFEGTLPGIEKLERALSSRYAGIDLPCLPGFRRCARPIRGLF